MSIEELIAAMQAIIDEASASEAAGGPGLTDEAAARYEELEGQLTRARKADEIQRRHAALKAPAPGQLVTGAKPKADDTLERAFDHYMRTGQPNSDLVELRAQGEGTDSAGGYLVPPGFRQKLVDRLKDFGGLANVVEEFTTSTGNSLEWPTVDDTANTGEIVAEGNTFSSGADLVFGSHDLGAFKYMAGGAGNLPLRVSWELLQDSAFDVESLVSRKLGERIARIQAAHWVNGTGTGQPDGIAVGVTGVGVDAITYENLLEIVHSVDPAYRGNARWAFNDATLQAVRGVLDASGRPLLVDASNGIEGDPGGATLLGYPVTIDQAFTTFDGAADTANMGVFGDLREAYVIRRVRDITLVVNPYARAAYGQTEFHAWARADGTKQNVNAYVAFTGVGA